MAKALADALTLENGLQGEPWVAGRYQRTAQACVRRGLADTYRVTPQGRDYYLLNDNGRRYLDSQ